MFLCIFLFVFSGDLAFRAQGNGFKLLSGCLLHGFVVISFVSLFVCVFDSGSMTESSWRSF